MDIKIVENDADLLTVKVDGRGYVYNKAYGYWYDVDSDSIIDMPPDVVEAIFGRSEESNRMIEDFPNYVYHE